MEQLGLVALVALVAPLGTWLAHPSQLGPLVPSKSSAGQSWQPTVAWARLARGTERFLAVSPAGVEQHLTIPSPQPAQRNVQQALIWEKQRARGFSQH